ncbi:MAG: hypothetical protein OQL11_08375 [Gammaproteobacteria bacterium]|nr:hypothetical protein [Gammaproteobacteria bacterium]
MAQCPKCKGTGRVLSHLNAYDPNKVGAGMGMHRCDRCAGQGIVHGMGGGGGAGSQLMAIVMGLFLHPVYSYFGFWLVCTVLLLTLGEVLGPLLGLDNLPNWYFLSAVTIPVALAVLLRKRIPALMKWIFYILIGGIVLFIGAAIISVIIEKSTSG